MLWQIINTLLALAALFIAAGGLYLQYRDRRSRVKVQIEIVSDSFTGRDPWTGETLPERSTPYPALKITAHNRSKITAHIERVQLHIKRSSPNVWLVESDEMLSYHDPPGVPPWIIEGNRIPFEAKISLSNQASFLKDNQGLSGRIQIHLEMRDSENRTIKSNNVMWDLDERR